MHAVHGMDMEVHPVRNQPIDSVVQALWPPCLDIQYKTAYMPGWTITSPLSHAKNEQFKWIVAEEAYAPACLATPCNTAGCNCAKQYMAKDIIMIV